MALVIDGSVYQFACSLGTNQQLHLYSVGIGRGKMVTVSCASTEADSTAERDGEGFDGHWVPDWTVY